MSAFDVPPSAQVPHSGDRPFVELRAQSAFSFGESAVAPRRLAARARELGYDALGLTDASDLGGVITFAHACREEGIKPIVGAELMVRHEPRAPRLPLALLVTSAQGYRNLSALVTRARSGRVDAWRREDRGIGAGTPGRGAPYVTWDDVAERAEGLLLLTGPPSGWLAQLVVQRQYHEARRWLAQYRATFGDALAVEVQLHGAGRREAVLANQLIELAEGADVRWVVCHNPRYVDDAGRRALDVLMALRHRRTIDEAGCEGLLLPNDRWRLQEPAAVATHWLDRPNGLRASRTIADLCQFELAWTQPPLPAFGDLHGEDPDVCLERLAYDGMHKRWEQAMSAEQQTRVDKELRVIKELGYAGFFLVMHDAVRYARSQNILCQGRGSAASSAVTYCLEVTAIDPVAHKLLFERFLSEARKDGLSEAPDIDVDVEHDQRERVLDYMYDKYGRGYSAITCVVQWYSASTAVQDVCRAYSVPQSVGDALSKRVHMLEPSGAVARLREGLAKDHGLDVESARGEAILQSIAAFDGLPRMRSTHPGGFVLSAEPLGDYCPIEPTTMGRTIIQYDKDDLDLVGIPKYDFLGLGALSAVRRAFDLVERRDKARPQLYKIDLEDATTYSMISRGDTLGTFQIESRAQIASLVNTKPERIYDIVVQVALIRPGPVVAKFVHPYTQRRRGHEDVFYEPGLEAKMKPALERTYGIPIFQEQAMALAMSLANYNAVEADALRRTMGHQRKKQRLEAELRTLRERMIANDIPPDVATRLTGDMASFANYGFPESHAWSFGLIAYVTAWLKCHHPAAFYGGLLDAQPMGFYSVATLIHDARRHDVEVRYPCLARGEATCTLEPRADSDKPALRLGWSMVRGIGKETVTRITAARARGPFDALADVVRRASLTRAEAAALARGHAMAHWAPNRREALWEALRAVGDALPLGPTPPSTERSDGYAAPALGAHEAVVADYHAVGCSTAGHPMEQYRAWCRRVGALDSRDLLQARSGERVVVAGLVTVRQRPATANGTLFLLLEDEHGQINVVCWKRIEEQYRETIRHAQFVVVYGTAEHSGALVSVIARRVEVLATDGVLTHQTHSFR